MRQFLDAPNRVISNSNRTVIDLCAKVCELEAENACDNRVAEEKL